jgi:hypothetical protein
MNKEQRKFWQPYIDVIGEENFYIKGLAVVSKHYSGMDISQSLGAEKYAKPQLQSFINKYHEYQAILNKDEITNDDMDEIFSWLVEKPFFDTELLRLLETKKVKQTLNEHWETIKSAWARQEFNTDGNRKENWKKIFQFRPTTPELTEGLPENFTAYRAGKADGFSWTLDKATAEWFHKRFKQQFGSLPFLTKQFTVKDVIFYTNDRNEEEVVIVPNDKN